MARKPKDPTPAFPEWLGGHTHEPPVAGDRGIRCDLVEAPAPARP